MNMEIDGDLHEANDDEVDNLTADIGMFDLQDASVSDQTLINIDPLILAPQLESNEFCAHAEEQRILEAAENAFTANVDNAEAGQVVDMPFQDEEQNHEDDPETTEERLPMWRQETSPRRSAPAAYISRYNSNKPALDLGDRTSETASKPIDSCSLC